MNNKGTITLSIFIIVNILGCTNTAPQLNDFRENNVSDDPSIHCELGVENNSEESVEIEGVQYFIPQPWKGNVINIQIDPHDLVLIPFEFTEGKEIYVTVETRDAFVSMALEARWEGVSLKVASGYRSYEYQKMIVKKSLTQCRTFSNTVKWIAPPGYSEHITGEALDFTPTNQFFTETKVYQWLKSNAFRYCFKESYPKDMRGGFEWEPWHWNYNGCEEI